MLLSIPATQTLLPTSSKSYTTTYILVHLYFWSLAICKVIDTKHYKQSAYALAHEKLVICNPTLQFTWSNSPTYTGRGHLPNESYYIVLFHFNVYST